MKVTTFTQEKCYGSELFVHITHKDLTQGSLSYDCCNLVKHFGCIVVQQISEQILCIDAQKHDIIVLSPKQML